MKFKNIITDFFKILTLLCFVAGLASCSFDKKESSQEKAEPNIENGVNLVLKIKGISKDNGLYIQPDENDYDTVSDYLNESVVSILKYDIKYCKGDSISANAISINNLENAALAAGIPLEGLSVGNWTFYIKGKKNTGSWDSSTNDWIYEDFIEGTKTQQLEYGNNSVVVELFGKGSVYLDFYTITNFGSYIPKLTLYYYDKNYYPNVISDKYPDGISYIDFLKAFTSTNPQNESGENPVIRSQDVKTVSLEATSLQNMSESIQKWGIPSNSTTAKRYKLSSDLNAGMYFIKLTIGETPTVLLSEQLKIVPGCNSEHEFIYQHDKREIKYKPGTNETNTTIMDYLTDSDKEKFEEYHYDTYFKGIQKTLEIVPEWAGHTFTGWKYEGSDTDLEPGEKSGTYIFENNTNVAYVTIVAQWVEN